MRPTNLAVRGLKCWDDTQIELAPLTALMGPNGIGKTALIQGFRLALLGYDPETGKQLKDTRKIVNEAYGEAEIGLSFDSGFGIRRRFGRKTETQVMPSRGESTGQACQERINEETGGVVVSLDLAEFIDLSDEKRRAWMFEHLPRDVAEFTWETFASWTGAADNGLEDVVKNLWSHSVQSAPNPVVGLSSAIEVARREFLEADRQRQDQVKIVERGAEHFRRAEEPAVVLPADIEDLTQQIAGLNQRIGEARQGRESLKAITERIERADSELGRAQRQRDHTAAVRADLAAQLEALAEPEPIEGLSEQVAQNTAERVRVGRELADARDLLARARARLDELRGREKEFDRRGVCPYAELGCSTDTAAIIGAAREELTAAISVATDEFERELAAEAKVLEELDALEAEHRRLSADLNAATGVVAKRAELERSIEGKDVLVRELEERVEIHRADLDAARAEAATLQESDAAATLYSERDSVTESLRALEERRDARVRYDERIAAHKAEQERLERHVARAEALKELDGNLRRLRAHVIEQMIEPLEVEAAAILAAIDPAKTFRFVFERENRATMDFGFEEDGALRLFDAASKGERVLLTVAFVGALLRVLDPPMRLLVIDDVEQLWPAQRRRLMEVLAELRDLWDAVVIAGACDLAGVDGWEVVDLRLTATAEAAA